jgi:hypothetical protein
MWPIPNLAGCDFELVADYRDSLEFVVRTLEGPATISSGGTTVPFQESSWIACGSPWKIQNRRFVALNHCHQTHQQTSSGSGKNQQLSEP